MRPGLGPGAAEAREKHSAVGRTVADKRGSGGGTSVRLGARARGRRRRSAWPASDVAMTMRP